MADVFHRTFFLNGPAGKLESLLWTSALEDPPYAAVGAGLSEGEHAGGFGERGDVQAALDFLAAEYPGRPIVLAGFSFGSWVGLRVGCKDERVEKLIGLGVPVDRSNLEYLFDCTKPKLIVQGGNDEFGSRANVEALFAQMPEPKQLVFVHGVDHFFAGKLPEVAAAIDAWLDASTGA
jgi:alpha/beta superfamily hydrolase